jgi:hypothetical protein
MRLTKTNMIAYELLPRLKYLVLGGQDDDGELEFIGTQQQYQQVENEILASEMGWPCGDASNHNNFEDDCTLCGVIRSGI